MTMPFKRILVIKLKHIGDVLLTTPVLTALKEAWPDSRLSVVVPRGTEEMLTDNPGVDEILVSDRQGESWSRALAFVWGLRRRRFDLVLELSGGDRGALYTWLSGAKERLGFYHPRRSGWQRAFAFTRLLPSPAAAMHTVDQNLAAVRALGVTPRDTRLKFFWNSEVEARLQGLLTAHGLREKAFAVVHPPARWLFKTWTAAGYARVGEALEERWGLPVVLTSGPAPQELRLVADIQEQMRTPPLSLAGQLSLKELGALIARARIFIGVDSAPMHLAAAVGTPTLAIFGPTGDYNWSPWGVRHVIVTKDMECRPCGRDGCEGSKVSRCLTGLTPEEVLAGVEQLLDGGGDMIGVEEAGVPGAP